MLISLVVPAYNEAKRILATTPDDPTALFIMAGSSWCAGQACTELGQIQRAITYFEEAHKYTTKEKNLKEE